MLDTGLRTEVTGGKQMGPLTGLVAQIFVDEGFPPESVHFERSLELPGYYRPTKQWDLLVVHEGILVAVVELKSIASSFGQPQQPHRGSRRQRRRPAHRIQRGSIRGH